MRFIDAFLNQITMYRLVVYVLRGFLGLAIILAFFGFLPFTPQALIFSTLLLFSVGWGINKIFARHFKVDVNVESYEISVYILALIIEPPVNFSDVSLIFWAVSLAIVSKFIVAFGKKHIFNPAALGIALTALLISQSASWWVGNQNMIPFVAVGGFLVLRKIQRFDLFCSFLLIVLALEIALGNQRGIAPMVIVSKLVIDSPLIFFATIMLTEPSTTPPNRKLRIVYGALVGVLFALPGQFGRLSFTPEIALLFGNFFSYLVSPKERLILAFKEKIQLAFDEWEFVFTPDKKPNFTPGQYMEWTLPPDKMDVRGNRRYFTLASSPTEENVRLGVKFYENSSSYKKRLVKMNINETIVVSQLSGEFILDRDPKRKYVFLAGGIGVTPYRSIVKFLLDTNQKRDFVLFYGEKLKEQLMYRDIFGEAEKKLGSKIIYVLSDRESATHGWNGEVGHIDSAMIANKVPDYMERYFYISGSHDFVKAMETEVKKLNVPSSQVKTDFFPGYA